MFRLLFLFLPILLFAWTPEQEMALQDIADLFGIPKHENLVEASQRIWHQGYKERWHFDSRYEEMRSELWPHFEKIGFIHTVEPTRDKYDYLLVFGALLPTVRHRLNAAFKLWEKGIRFDQIVLLSGERALQPSEIETIQSAGGEIPSSEAEMVRWLYDHSVLPAGMENVPVLLIDAPAQPGNARATTYDTVVAWSMTNPKPGSCLAISNQPYIAYQQAVSQKLLPPGFTLETVGPAIGQSSKVALILDTLARTLEEKK